MCSSDLAGNVLGSRNEKGIPNTLLQAAENDSSLDVVKACMGAFSRITGYKSSGVFAYKQAKNWWLRNRENISSKFSEQVR